MKILLTLVFCLVTLAATAQAAMPPVRDGAAVTDEEMTVDPILGEVPAIVATGPTEYLIDDTTHRKMRDSQYDIDQLEIENQALQVRIERNKAKQAELLAQVKAQAYEFSTKAKIDLGQYQLDMRALKFVRKGQK